MKTVVQFLVSVVMMVLMVYGILYFCNIETGDLMDWMVGTASFVWLMVIVTVPWNAHFKAKEVLDEAATSKRKEILVIESRLDYVRKVAKRSLYVAIGLHLFSAVVMYIVAIQGVSPVGYYGAVAALLLTFLRPAVRFYEYLYGLLNNIRQEFRFPREDVHEILTQFKQMQSQLALLEATLDPEQTSWRHEVDNQHRSIKGTLQMLEDKLKQFQKDTAGEFEIIKLESKQQFDKLVADSQILDSVRVLANFWKEMKG